MNALIFILGMVGAFTGGFIFADSLATGADIVSALEQSYEIFGLGVICAWLGWRE